jgi:hypothetical protein
MSKYYRKTHFGKIYYNNIQKANYLISINEYFVTDSNILGSELSCQ